MGEVEALAEVLAEHWSCESTFQGGKVIRYACGIEVDGPRHGLADYNRAHVAAVLAPVVAEAVAAGLREAAEVCASSPNPDWRHVGDMLVARAARIVHEGGRP